MLKVGNTGIYVPHGPVDVSVNVKVQPCAIALIAKTVMESDTRITRLKVFPGILNNVMFLPGF